MKNTYYIYWTPQKYRYAKVEAENPQDAFAVLIGKITDPTRAKVIQRGIAEYPSDFTYDVYEPGEEKPIESFTHDEAVDED